jgi:3-dehydrosphinganine reductase
MAKSTNSFQGRLALITGGSSGIGLALAQQLAREGASVWILARRKELLEAAYKSLPSASGQKHGTLVLDVSKWHQVEPILKRFQREVGVPDLLINSAGVTHPGYVQGIPLEIFHEMMDIDYFGIVHTVKAFLPAMIERGSGYIVNISSGAGYLGLFGYSAYGAAKYAVRGFSDVLRAEVKPLGVKVSVVFPPDTDTPQLAYENQFKPFETRAITGNGGVLSPEKVAKSILDGVRRGQYAIVPGFQNGVAYVLSGLLGNAIYPIMDGMIADARKKKKAL